MERNNGYNNILQKTRIGTSTKTDYVVAKTNFEQKLKTGIPSRDAWAKGNLDDTFEISLYTDDPSWTVVWGPE